MLRAGAHGVSMTAQLCSACPPGDRCCPPEARTLTVSGDGLGAQDEPVRSHFFSLSLPSGFPTHLP